ncbi:MAG: ABC transporter ATP-binding protein [Deltaproteobacteria bacterium]|nr:ABC transporter ATP-binding protein [Deltaproteobacteria bacterium]
MALLKGEKVTRYFGGLAAVFDVSFEVQQGEALGLIGPNGAGKTTLFNLISAALTPRPGAIYFKGRKITGLSPYRICRMGVARTFQTVKVFPDLPVLTNVMLGASFGASPGLSWGDAAEEASEILEFVELSAVRDTPAGELTLANQKRLEVARALATRPDLLLLDEIMEGLNPTEIARSMELIRSIRGRGVTIIMIEHVMKAIMNLCDRIMVLHHGSKLAEGTPGEIAASDEVIRVYLGERAHAGS